MGDERRVDSAGVSTVHMNTVLGCNVWATEEQAHFLRLFVSPEAASPQQFFHLQKDVAQQAAEVRC